MAETADHLPEDAAALKAALIETRAKLSGAEALIAHLQVVIEKMKRAMFGPRSERAASRHKSMAMSPSGCEQQISTLPSAGASTGWGR